MNQLKHIAKKFIDDLNQKNPIDPNYEYQLDPTPEDFGLCLYFDILIQPKINILKGKAVPFGGARGFTVSKQTQEIAYVSFGGYFDLKEEKKQFDSLNDILKEPEIDILRLKQFTGLTPYQIIKLKRIIASKEMKIKENRVGIIGNIVDLMNGNAH